MVHVGFVVLQVASKGDLDVNGKALTLDALRRFAASSGGLMWVQGDDLLTHQPLDSTGIRKDS